MSEDDKAALSPRSLSVQRPNRGTVLTHTNTPPPRSHAQVVVVFSVQWCALCSGYAPEFTRVADAFAGLVDTRSKAPVAGPSYDAPMLPL